MGRERTLRALGWVALLACAACRRADTAAGADGRSTAPVAASRGDDAVVLATFAGGAITRADVAAALARRFAGLSQPASEEARRAVVREVLERRARVSVLYEEAVARGIAGRPEIQMRLAAAEQRLLAEDWLSRHVRAGVHADADLVAAEVVRRAPQATEETRRFSHIFLRAPESDPEARRSARATMQTVRAELAAGAPFDALARRYSDSITARAGGRVDWTRRDALNDTVGAVVFGLGAERVSEPVETRAGLHLVRLDAVREAPFANLEGLRRKVEEELDAEAVEAAVTAARLRAFDDSGATLDLDDGEIVARAGDVVVHRRALEVVRATWPPYRGRSEAAVARELVVNEVLAARRRGEGVDDALAARVAAGRRALLIDARREELVAALPAAVSAEDEAAFYDERRDTALALREHVVDVLFLPELGAGPAAVYADGETVVHRLRDGVGFDEVLRMFRARPGVVARTELEGVTLEGLQGESSRARAALVNLAPGEVSAPVYVAGEQLSFGQPAPVVRGKGVLFLRLVAVRPLSLEAARPVIHALLVERKVRDGVAALRRDLEARSDLKILVPDG